jgi:hypothetical protein
VSISEFIQTKQKNPFPSPSTKKGCTPGFMYTIQLIIVDLRADVYSVLYWYIMHNICPNGIFGLNLKVEDTASKQQYRWEMS